jgi:hypothetical protein
MEWDERGSPFDEVGASLLLIYCCEIVADLIIYEQLRRAFFSGVKDTFSTPPPPRPVRRANDTAQE